MELEAAHGAALADLAAGGPLSHRFTQCMGCCCCGGAAGVGTRPLDLAAAGAVAATGAAKPIVDFLIKQFKTGFKILFNKLLKKKPINYLDEKKFPRKKIELPARLRFEKGHPPLGQLRLGKDLRKEKKDAGKHQP